MATQSNPSEVATRSVIKSITLDDVKEWPEIGDTYNEEYGVDHVHAMKINGDWAYVQIEWSHHIPSLGFIFYGGKKLESLTELVATGSGNIAELVESAKPNPSAGGTK